MSQQTMQPRAPRFNIRLSAEIKVDTATVTGTTRNLSTGGVCVEIDRPVQEGKMIRLKLFIVEDEIETEGARSLDLSGTVQWTAEGDRGTELFLNLVNLDFQPQLPADAWSEGGRGLFLTWKIADAVRVERAAQSGTSIIAGNPMRKSLKRGRTLSTAVRKCRKLNSIGEGEISLSFPLRITNSTPPAMRTIPAIN